MIKTFVVVFAIACQFAFGIVDPKEQFEIREGNCSNARLRDLVFEDNVDLMGIPFITRNTTSTWYGDQIIYCILALSQNPESNGSTVFIKEGGVNHSYVTLEFHSTKNHGLEYNIKVFGRLR
nr:uncharacterized protein LOC111502601 [Leptinotarsa decemlineata]